MQARVGFACQWGLDRKTTWSGTPWQLRSALDAQCDLVDVDASVPPLVARGLRLAWARRANGRWESKWGHGRPARAIVERRLAAAVQRANPSVVVQIQDLGVVERPYFILQDLSYDLLCDHFGERGVPHFRSLSRRQILGLRDRQHRVYAGANGLLPMSEWLAARIIESGIPSQRVHVVNPGVNAPLDPDLPVPERRRGRRRRLLFVGRDFETKAGDQVVAAFTLLRKQFGPDITLTIAGPKRWPLASRPPDGIEYIGAVPPSTVQSLYDSHDLFVMPSRFEGFGIAFVEALVRGLPCIGRNSCAMPEIIESGSGGLLVQREDPVELSEAINIALADDALYENCAKAAPMRRAHYTWERAAREVLAAISAPK
jgi:glycosyltransferase involved in cell wall biosynthesis